MDISPVFFLLFAVLALAFSLLVVCSRSAVASAFSLAMVFLSFAAIYAMLGAHLVAALQLLVYAGAVVVLFVFVIMLLNADTRALDLPPRSGFFVLASLLVATSGFSFFVHVVRGTIFAPGTGRFNPEQIEAAGGNTRAVSDLLFSEYALPFELTSIVLLAAIITAVAIAKRHPKKAVPEKGAKNEN